MGNDFDSFSKDYRALLDENKQLKEEIKQLRQHLGIENEFAIIDQKIVWYGSINLLSFGTAEESMMRLVSTNVAYELGKST